jgi:hypothetical protein
MTQSEMVQCHWVTQQFTPAQSYRHLRLFFQHEEIRHLFPQALTEINSLSIKFVSIKTPFLPAFE